MAGKVGSLGWKSAHQGISSLKIPLWTQENPIYKGDTHVMPTTCHCRVEIMLLTVSGHGHHPKESGGPDFTTK